MAVRAERAGNVAKNNGYAHKTDTDKPKNHTPRNCVKNLVYASALST